MRFSGVNRPGLIEAYAGSTDRASIGRFSGVNRPGLIEATWQRQTTKHFGSGFPGLIAPASLKPWSMVTMLGFCPGFPGLIAPASLKRATAPWRRFAGLGFSGVNRPGLIEAAGGVGTGFGAYAVFRG